ncbi:glycosyl-4,4'-diaponeurosporenoate acyltransferase CrtO family protein [Labilibaculum antarcticum]|uniref:Glycosyl-4,4'-diaponeurosporenoate acyltransferase n=1 Tax=Labilibaculum antarcticum TaxID=1717717 RepID=A0A1Y1CDJ8_9BACT|nr:hypothetical protein [Labilibaculum antarcticum]BAX78418.1 hypothetical protein ALGA_0023 [Labilibaculum antarcticum]
MRNFTKSIVFGFKTEIQTEVYERLGVRHFKKIVPFGDFWIRLYNKVFTKQLSVFTSRQNAILWFIFTLVVEFVHCTALIFLLWLTIQSTINAEYYKALKITLINIVINLYPIFVQRYNRIRILRTYKITMTDLNTF